MIKLIKKFTEEKEQQMGGHTSKVPLKVFFWLKHVWKIKTTNPPPLFNFLTPTKIPKISKFVHRISLFLDLHSNSKHNNFTSSFSLLTNNFHLLQGITSKEIKVGKTKTQYVSSSGNYSSTHMHDCKSSLVCYGGMK